MAFSSLIFVFIFFPAFFLLFLLSRKPGYRNTILFIGSIVFFSWADLAHVHVLFISIILNYAFGRIIFGRNANGKTISAEIFLWLGITLDLGLLFLYKYLDFFGYAIMTLSGASFTLEKVALPLGISYFTFSGISYLIDVYQNIEKPEMNLLRFSNFIVMFPKLLQGPITRFGQVKHELGTISVTMENLNLGIRRFVTGLGKKVLIADTLSIMADKVLNTSPERYGVVVAWTGIIAYALQIYYDFSGYTDMAIGIGKVVGFTLPENFNYPYTSRSVTEFWRRWHMTLTSWFRTYVFIPLEFLRKKQKYLRLQTNLIIVFLLTGLWHGAGWNFVIWGLYFGIILAFESGLWGRKLRKTHPIFRHFYTILLILISWIIFRFPDAKTWGTFFNDLLGFNGLVGITTLRSLNILMYWPVIVVGLIGCTQIGKRLVEMIESKGYLGKQITNLFYVAILFVVIVLLISKGYNSFLYAQF